MSTEAQQSYGTKEPIGPKTKEGYFYTNESTMPHSGVHGFERPEREFDKTSLQEAAEKGLLDPKPPQRTSDLPADLQAPSTREAQTGTETEPWYKKRIVQLGAVAAVAATVAGAIGMSMGGDSDKAPQPRAAAVGAPNPGETTQTPTATPSETTTTESVDDVVNRLTIPASVYSTEYLQKNFVASPDTLDKAFAKYEQVNKYRDVREHYKDALLTHEQSIGRLTADKLIDAQARYQALMDEKIYTDESITSGEPKETMVGAYLSQPSSTGIPNAFPNGFANEKTLKSWKKYANPSEPLASPLVQNVYFDSRMDDELNMLFDNLNAVDLYNAKLSEDDKDKKILTNLNPRAFAEANYIAVDSGFADSIAARLSEASTPNSQPNAPQITEGYVVETFDQKLPYGNKTVDAQAFTMLYERADTKNLFLQTVALIPLESHYVDGKKVNKPWVQPVIVATDILSEQ